MSAANPGWVFSGRAQRELRKLDRQVANRVIDALDRLCGDPPVGDVKHLTGSNPPEWRLRVGDWRVRFARDDTGMIVVTRVLPRGRAYRD